MTFVLGDFGLSTKINKITKEKDMKKFIKTISNMNSRYTAKEVFNFPSYLNFEFSQIKNLMINCELKGEVNYLIKTFLDMPAEGKTWMKINKEFKIYLK